MVLEMERKDMFVPFVFDMFTYQSAPRLWTFCKGLDFAKKTGSAVIANEVYSKTPITSFQKDGRWEVENWDLANRSMQYQPPKEAEWPFQQAYAIPDSLLAEIVEEKGSIADAYNDLLTQPDPRLVQFLDGLIGQIETDLENKIEGFLSFQAALPSLEAVAEKHGIPVIHWELGCWRYPTYLSTVYWDLEDLYGGKTVEKRWHQFCAERKEKEFPILSKQECLALLLEKENLYLVDEYGRRPVKKVGAALGYAMMELITKESKLNDSEMLYQIREAYGLENMMVRKHPGDPYCAQYPIYAAAMEPGGRCTPEFLLDCETVVSLISGSCMEAMLFNRKAITLFPSPSYFASGHKIGEEGVCLGEDFISFFAFCYLVPLEYMSDPDYFRWRLTMPTEREIYIKHLKFYLEKKGLSTSLIDKRPGERLELMLSAQGYRPKAVFALEEKLQFSIREKQDLEERMLEMEDRVKSLELLSQRLEEEKYKLEERAEFLEQEKQLLEEQIRDNCLVEQSLQKETETLRETVYGWELELKAVQASVSYRLGRTLTWLPRKLRGGVRCVRENGWAYTVRHLLGKLEEKR